MWKVIVPWPHDSSDLGAFYLAVTRREPASDDWAPALRDTIEGRPVLWARFPTAPARNADVWVRHNGQVTQIRSI